MLIVARASAGRGPACGPLSQAPMHRSEAGAVLRNGTRLPPQWHKEPLRDCLVLRRQHAQCEPRWLRHRYVSRVKVKSSPPLTGSLAGSLPPRTHLLLLLVLLGLDARVDVVTPPTMVRGRGGAGSVRWAAHHDQQTNAARMPMHLEPAAAVLSTRRASIWQPRTTPQPPRPHFCCLDCCCSACALSRSCHA